ncbi:MAG: sterol desaturase/sphingolipid hydroxylase (fatty acid hydroxylase superfamily) [Bacteroidia bacterium]|jgi:sterol desaturase/sphingolipid hydroxylase (fatty acid hydroxylase superfamily)
MSTEMSAVHTAPVWFQWSVFPLVMGAAVYLSWVLMQTGMDPALAIFGPQLGGIALVALAERLYPYHQSWLRSHDDIRVDVAHTLTLGVSSSFVNPAVISGGVLVAAWLSVQFNGSLWPVQWALGLQIILALLIGELPGYWMHRLQHSWDGMWRFHSVHHSAPRLYWLNAGRFHVVDLMATYVPTYLLLAVVGCPGEVIAFFGLISAVHGIFQHSNLQLRLGPLNWFFSMAELHRWHHSRTVEEANTNFGQTVSVWDWVFGTRFLPADREPPRDIGIADMPNFPMTWWAQVMAPFRWRRVKEEASGSVS